MQHEKWQRNLIFKALVDGGLDPNDCKLDYDDTETRISHTPSGSYFLMEGDAALLTATTVIGDGAPRHSDSFTVVVIEDRIRAWARLVKDDVDTPDLWAELQRQREVLTGVLVDDDVENTPFSADEQAEIAEQLRQIKALVAEKYPPRSDADMRVLEARFDGLEAAMRRMGRKDWLLQFLGVMFSVIVTGLLTPEAVQDILAMTLHGLQHLYGGGGPGPLLPPPR